MRFHHEPAHPHVRLIPRACRLGAIPRKWTGTFAVGKKRLLSASARMFCGINNPAVRKRMSRHDVTAFSEQVDFEPSAEQGSLRNALEVLRSSEESLLTVVSIPESVESTWDRTVVEAESPEGVVASPVATWCSVDTWYRTADPLTGATL